MKIHSQWRPYHEAPTDGTVIIAVYEDWSGCNFICRGTYEKGEGEGWFEYEKGQLLGEALFGPGCYWMLANMPEGK